MTASSMRAGDNPTGAHRRAVAAGRGTAHAADRGCMMGRQARDFLRSQSVRTPDRWTRACSYVCATPLRIWAILVLRLLAGALTEVERSGSGYGGCGSKARPV